MERWHMTMRVLPTLHHPFDDPVFAAMARVANIVREDLPDIYDPDVYWEMEDWQDHFPDISGFSFSPGDDIHHGSMRIIIDGDAGVSYRNIAGSPYIDLRQKLPQTVMTALVGRQSRDLVAIPGVEEWVIHWMMQEDGLTSALLQPPEHASIPAYDIARAA